MSNPAISPDILDLLDKVARHPVGFQLLYKGNLESVAVLFGIHPFVLDRARSMLRDPLQRHDLGEALAAARARHRLGQPIEARCGHPPEAARPHLGPQTHEALIAMVGDTPFGLEFLLRAPLETIAILFDAHPSLVLEAREDLRKRGMFPDPVDPED